MSLDSPNHSNKPQLVPESLYVEAISVAVNFEVYTGGAYFVTKPVKLVTPLGLHPPYILSQPGGSFFPFFMNSVNFI